MDIGMHSVKSETKCIATIGTVTLLHVHRQFEQQLIKFPLYRRLLLANNKDTSPAVPMGTALSWAIIGLGLEFF